MRVINQPSDDREPLFEEAELGEVFTYVTKRGTPYLLMCQYEGRHLCAGCVFSADSNHPLKHVLCNKNGLACERKVFKDINVVLENL